MRNHGERVELVHLRLHDHIGWVYSGDDQFVSLATKFLAEAPPSELLMYVAESPEMSGPLADLATSIEPERLQIGSVAEVYGDSGLVDSERQRSVFAGALEQALTDGYDGIRVAADNTWLVADPERRDAWYGWEHTADHFMSEHPVIGLCAFDRERIDVGVLRHLATLHPLTSALGPLPRFRLFVDAGALWLEGDVTTLAVDEAARALACIPAVRQLVVDMTNTTLVTQPTIARIEELCTTGVSVTVLTDSAAVYDRANAVDEAAQLADFAG
jgi:hypothetical protein